jgi:hypothetical protein
MLCQGEISIAPPGVFERAVFLALKDASESPDFSTSTVGSIISGFNSSHPQPS